MPTTKTLIHQVLKLGLENTNDIRSLFETLSPSIHDLNIADDHGDTLAHFAARAHALNLLQLLHQYQVNMTTANEHGRQALHEAIDDLPCVQYLVGICGVDTNAMKRGDWTPVMIAALKGDLAIVQYLVERGALLNLKSKDGRTPLHMAVQEGHTKVATYLASQHPDSMFITTNSGRLPVQMAAAMTTDGPLAQSLLLLLPSSSSTTTTQGDAQWIIAHEDRSGRTILEDAVVANQIDLVAWLVKTYDADLTRHDALGRNVWHHAAMVGHVAMLERLGQWPILKPLLDAADLWDAWTPLFYAAKQGHLDCVVCLLKMQADPTRTDKLGRTAKDLASLWHHDDIVKILE